MIGRRSNAIKLGKDRAATVRERKRPLADARGSEILPLWSKKD
jgi:hypothetical protein